jgi:ParB-like chromosome segregation protein Spo0J
MKWSLIEVEIKQIKNNPKNPRQIGSEKFEKLSGVLEKFGLIDKPIINRDMVLIGGHQRVRYLKKKKEKMVECWIPEFQLEDKDVDELCVGLNLHQGDWDWDILANQWEPLDLLKYGFSEEKLFQEVEEKKEKKSSNKKNKCCPNCGHEF